MSKPVLRIGVIGVGAIAQLAHLPLLAKMKGVEVVALCDSDRAKARALAERFGVPNVETDIEELLELDPLDAILISTPNHLHEPHVLSALRRGVHVLCERPLALTSKGIERILAAAQKADRVVQVGHNQRFRSEVQALDAFVRGGELGRLVGIRCGAYKVRRGDAGWRARRAEAGGGIFLDSGFPLLDLACWLADFPDPVRVSATMDRGSGARAVEDSMAVQIEFATGLSLVIDTAWGYVGEEDRMWFEILGSRGTARLSPLRVVKELNGKPVDVSPSGAAARDSAFTMSYRASLAHFIAVVNGEVEYEPPVKQLDVWKLVESAYRSADEKKEIRL
ncbi:MAG: Gfo/Idh/MocA family oxidoreductase [Gemmatimonadaceae bacterium]|jgi:predicted dehydrogenase|nr:Gfo/Idh/MocA family oxidoreductase [Gemmatimonadaceae bacterium]